MRLLGSTIARLHSLVVQRSLHEQSRTTQLRLCLPHLSDLQQLAAAALGTHTIRSSNSWGTQLPACGSVRSMAGRTHKLSLKKANNKASWMAVQPYLQQEQQQQSDQLQQRRAQVIQSAIPALPVLEEPILYQRIGKITGPYRVGPQVGVLAVVLHVGFASSQPRRGRHTVSHPQLLCSRHVCSDRQAGSAAASVQSSRHDTSATPECHHTAIAIFCCVNRHHCRPSCCHCSPALL